MRRIGSGFAVMLMLSMLVATAVGLGLARLGVDDPEIALLPAVVLAWLIDGIAGGVAAIALATAIAWYIFLPPSWTFSITSAAELAELVLYVCVIAFVSYVVHGQKNRIIELIEDNRALNRRLLERESVAGQPPGR